MNGKAVALDEEELASGTLDYADFSLNSKAGGRYRRVLNVLRLGYQRASSGHTTTSPPVRRYKGRLTPFWIAYDCLVATLMLGSVAALYIYVFWLTPTTEMRVSTNVYDADLFSPARYFLLRRQCNSQPAGEQAQPDSGTTAAV